MTNRKFNVVPVKTSIVTADKIILIDSEDSNKLKQADATAFKGIQGDIGATGPAGANGTNGTNGTDGANGIDGVDGNSIVSVILTSGDHSAGTLDTYTITYTDLSTSTFQVYNGANGTGAGDMLKTENLSGLANYETARANLGIIDDITPSTTKAYSSDKTQAMHNAQAQAIQNLSGASATFHSSTPTLIPETPTAFLDLTWTNDMPSSNTSIFELGTNEVTFKKDGNYNFLNSMVFSRASSGATVNITFEIYDADTSTVLLSAVQPLDIPAGTSETVPMNVLLPITGTTDIDHVRMKVRMQASSVAGTVTMDSFSTILFAQSVANISDIDATPTYGSFNAVQSHGVYDALALKAPLASPTFTGTVTTPAITITTGAGLAKVLTSDAAGIATWQTPSGGTGGGSQCEPLQDYQGTAIIGVLGTYVFDSSKTGTKYSLTSDSIPVGSNLIVELRKNSYTTGNVLSSTLQIATTDTLTNGKKTVSITDTDSYVAGDYVVAYLTSVGSTTPALNPYFTLTIA